jgi:methylenetetrahydrofolate--tRNA-(uracil-5-)-methyltransferase
VESIATGLAAGLMMTAHLRGDPLRPFPRETAIGSLLHYISHADPKHYQPANIAFDLFPPLQNSPRDRRERQIGVCELAAEKLNEYVGTR